MKYLAAFLSVWVLWFSCFGQAAADQGWEQRFHERITSWIASLSEKDPSFRSWADAPYEVENLGPNSKQWLVRILPKKGESGYMVIGETPQGEFSLLEYGLGGIPLFSQDLIRIYYPEISGQIQKTEKIYQGMQSFFRIQTREKTYTIDAKTGEEIPDSFVGESAERLTEGEFPIIQPEKLIFSFLKPLSVWEERFPVEAILYKRKELDGLNGIKDQEAFYEGMVWNGNMKLLLEVKGYHQWSDGVVYMALEQEGYRFLPIKNKTDGGKLPSVSFEQLFIVESGSAAPDKLVRQSALPH